MELLKVEHFGYPFFNTLIATRIATTPTHHYVMLRVDERFGETVDDMNQRQ